MNVIISPNIKKESVRINPAGDIINAKTKQVITPVEPEFVPPNIPTLDTIIEKPVSKIDDMINKLVEKKIEEIISKKIEEALNKL